MKVLVGAEAPAGLVALQPHPALLVWQPVSGELLYTLDIPDCAAGTNKNTNRVKPKNITLAPNPSFTTWTTLGFTFYLLYMYVHTQLASFPTPWWRDSENHWSPALEPGLGGSSRESAWCQGLTPWDPTGPSLKRRRGLTTCCSEQDAWVCVCWLSGHILIGPWWED